MAQGLEGIVQDYQQGVQFGQQQQAYKQSQLLDSLLKQDAAQIDPKMPAADKYQKLADDIFRYSPTLAAELSGQSIALKSKEAQTQKQTADAVQAQAENAGRNLLSATDQQTYEAARQRDPTAFVGLPPDFASAKPLIDQRAKAMLPIRDQIQFAKQAEQAKKDDAMAAHQEKMADISERRLENAEHKAQSSGSSVNKLDPDTLDYWADWAIAHDGKMPPMYRDNASRAALMSKIAEKQKDHGGAAGSQATSASIKADQASLNNITKIADASEAFENTAIKNLDRALQLAPAAVPNLGPFVNKWVEKGEASFGDKDIPPYVAALLTGANEYAKIIGGATGAQGSTVDARREASEILSPYFNTGQIKAVVDVAKNDMENKKKSYKDQRDAIAERIRKSASGDAPADAPKPAAPNAKPDLTYDPKTGKFK